jgi:hypothetical protein
MRKGKTYHQFPGFWLAPNGLQFNGVAMRCGWSIWLLGQTAAGDIIVRIDDAELDVFLLEGRSRWIGDFVHGGDTWGCEFWTRVLPTSPMCELGVHLHRSDGVTVDVRANRLLSDAGFWSGGGNFYNPTPGECVLPPEYRAVRNVTYRPTQYREEL